MIMPRVNRLHLALNAVLDLVIADNSINICIHITSYYCSYRERLVSGGSHVRGGLVDDKEAQ